MLVVVAVAGIIIGMVIGFAVSATLTELVNLAL
jgi:hypothetical protein